jgi:hypothetical protein
VTGNTGHPCNGGNNEITFVVNGVPKFRFIRLCGDEPTYWGGELAGPPGYAHTVASLHWMLAKLAELANDRSPAAFHELTGHGWRATIAKRMEADRIAGALACDEDRVRHYFSMSIEIPPKPEVDL